MEEEAWQRHANPGTFSRSRLVSMIYSSWWDSICIINSPRAPLSFSFSIYWFRDYSNIIQSYVLTTERSSKNSYTLSLPLGFTALKEVNSFQIQVTIFIFTTNFISQKVCLLIISGDCVNNGTSLNDLFFSCNFIDHVSSLRYISFRLPSSWRFFLTELAQRIESRLVDT